MKFSVVCRDHIYLKNRETLSLALELHSVNQKHDILYGMAIEKKSHALQENQGLVDNKELM